MVFFVFAFLLIGIVGFAHADSGNDNGNAKVNGDLEVHGNDSSLGIGASINGSASDNGSGDREREMEQNQTHKEDQNNSESETEAHYKYKGSDGKEYEVQVKTKIHNGEMEQEMEFHGYNVSSKLQIHVENKGNESKLRVNLSNGEQRDVKILPDVASERAIQVFQSRNITVQLKEVGNGTNSSLVYEADGEKEVKILGFINAKAKVQATIDSNTGEVTNVAGPWWSFLASGFNSDVSATGSSNASVDSNVSN